MKNLFVTVLSFLGLIETEEEEEEVFDEEGGGRELSSVRKISREPLPEAGSGGKVAVLKSLSRPRSDIRMIEPATFNDAQRLADFFKEGYPVAINLRLVGPELAKRLVDFCSGLTYALNGRIERVSEKVFVLIPKNIEVSKEELERLRL